MKKYGLIGYPLGHSFSKKYFTQKFEKEQLPYSFENFAIENILLLPALLQQNPELQGLCVTIPHKENIIPLLDELSPEVLEIGACNSVRISSGKLTGFNTDIIGFKQSLMRQLKPIHTRALILGTGGASKAVEYVFKQIGISFQKVSRQNNQDVISYETLNPEIMSDHLLIVNASPVGTFPDVDAFPNIPYQYLGKNHLLFDLVYNPEITTFMKKGMERGAAVQNGYEMLVGQAEASWELWNK